MRKMKPAMKIVLPALVLVLGTIIFHLLTRPAPSGPGDKTLKPGVFSSSPTLSSHVEIESKIHEIKTLELELQRKPNHTPILFRLAELSREMGKPGEAAKYLQQILVHEPKNVDARLELGRTLYEAGDIQGAIVETNHILEENPDHTEALYNLGAIYGNLNNEAMARKYWTRAIASNRLSESAQRAQQGLRQLGQLQ